MNLRRLGRLLCALAAAALLSACAPFVPPQTAALQAQRPTDLPERIELGATPFHPQTEFQCGPAALATLLGAAGVEADPTQLADEVFVPARKGSLQVEMLASARRHGVLAVRLPGELEAVLRELAAGHPVLVMQNLGLSFVPAWHYAVAVGYDLERSDLILRSGRTARELLAFRTFEHTWARSGHWAFAAMPPGQLPATASEVEVTAASVAFERVAPPAQAVQAYAAALQRWPASLTLAMGLGNARAAQGDVEAAAQTFAQAAQSHDSAAAWNNLAQMRLKQGRKAEAVEAARKAVQRAQAAEPQWLAAARSTLDEAEAH
ncbi:MAG TPA: PA2778 family cysteine peptidase [Methylibium sp.]